MLLRPELANRDCGFCQQYAHHDDGPVISRGCLVLRNQRVKPPDCRTKKGCHKGTPERKRSLSPANLLCYRHYQRCKAVGKFPADPLVSYHARVIAEVERECEQVLQTAMFRSLLSNGA